VVVPSEQDVPSLVVFWASWCGPCRREAVEIAGIVRSYGAQVSVVSVNSGEDATKARLAAEQWGMTWPVALDPRGRVSSAYEVTAVPLVLVIDADGVVRYRGNGLPSDPHRLLDGLSG
jgi:thiol-disulfide isomerase/thioredoxin